MKIKNIIRILIGTLLVLLIPLITMQFSDQVNWSSFDFTIAGILLFGTGLIYEFFVKSIENSTRRVVVGIILLFIFFLIWIDLAVGIFNIPGISGS